MTNLLNAVVLNGAVAVVLAIGVWAIAMVPAVRRRPGLRHCLWVIVLLKLVTPPLLELSILPDWRAAKTLPTTQPRAIPLDDSASLADSQTPNSWRAATSFSPAWHIGRISLLLVVGIGGIVVVLGVAAAQIWKLRQALRHGVPDDNRLGQIAAASACRMGMNRAPEVCLVSSRVSPLLWVRPSGPLIVVPRRLGDELTDEQLGCVVAHEIAHYLRRDHWTNLLSLLVAAICWWNPVAWWARRELRAAQEGCCDALVISKSVASRRKYAETLFQVLEFLQTERSLLPALASGFGVKSSTERRFEMIASPRVNHHLSWWSYPVLLVALAMLPCLPSFAETRGSVPVNECVHFQGVSPDGSPVEYWVAPGKQQICGKSADTIWFQDAGSQESLCFDANTKKIRRSKLGNIAAVFAGLSEILGAMQTTKDLSKVPPRDGARRIVVSQKISEVEVNGKKFADYEFVFDDPQGGVASSKSIYRVDLATRRPVQLRKWLELL